MDLKETRRRLKEISLELEEIKKQLEDTNYAGRNFIYNARNGEILDSALSDLTKTRRAINDAICLDFKTYYSVEFIDSYDNVRDSSQFDKEEDARAYFNAMSNIGNDDYYEIQLVKNSYAENCDFSDYEILEVKSL